MSNRVHLSDDLPEITTEIFTMASVIIGLRGSGKTNDGVVLAEQATKHGVPTAIIDPTGVWWGLKSSADGKSAGLPFYIFGGEHADVPLAPDAGPIVARFVVDERVPVICDVSDFSKSMRRRFAGQFSEALYDLKSRKRDPLLVIYDEVPMFCPQQTRGADFDLNRCIGAVEDIVQFGRSRGLGAALIGQRLATINKNIATQADNLFAMRSVGTPDRKAIDEWVTEAQADEKDRNELVSHIAMLKQGEGYFWSPSAYGIFRRVQFAARTTFDSSATPKVGKKRIEPTIFASVDLDALRGEIAAAAERVKADDPKALRARIAQLEKQLSGASSHVEKEEVRVQVPVLTDRDRQQLDIATRAIEKLSDRFDKLALAVEDADRAVRELGADVGQRIAAVREAVEPRLLASAVEISVPRQRATSKSPSSDEPSSGGLSGPDEKFLVVLWRQSGAKTTRRQLGALAGYSPKSSTFANYVSSLRVRGFVSVDSGLVSITEAGTAALGRTSKAAPITREQLVESWCRMLGGRQAQMLRILVEQYPRDLTRSELAERAGLSPTSSTFANYVSELKTNGLAIVKGGVVKANAEELML